MMTIDLKGQDYEVTDTNIVLISEDYLGGVLVQEGFFAIETEEGYDSNLICECASQLGFTNLGDFGDGFIFMKHFSKAEEYFRTNHFSI